MPGTRQLVLLNGHLVQSSHGRLPRGVIAGGLSESIRKHPQLLLRHLGRLTQASEHPFAALNTAKNKITHDGKEKDVELGAVIWVQFHDWQIR